MTSLGGAVAAAGQTAGPTAAGPGDHSRSLTSRTPAYTVDPNASSAAQAGAAMRLSLLGPVELTDDAGASVDVGPGKRRAALAALGLELNQVVAVERLLDILWDGNPPPRARTALQGHVSALRKLLGPGLRLVTRDPGYALVADPAAVDVHRFRALVEEAAAADDRAAAQLLRAALRLWRGPALADLAGRGLRDAVVAPLEEMRRDALAAFAQRLLILGSGADAVAELRAAVEADPLHEPLIAALVLCLHQAGRQADALGAYHAARRRLADELGVDPGTALMGAYHTVLRGARPPGDDEPPGEPTGPRPGPPAELVPAQLPRVPAGFVGRQAELAWLSGQLDGDRPVLVHGLAGIGKTALALRWAHQAARRFPDGQLFVNLRGLDPAGPAEPGAVLAGFLRALGTPGRDIPVLLDDQAALYRTRMTGRRMLIVLDNAGSADQVRPLLPGDPGSLVVITARTRLEGLIAHDGAAALTLSPVTSDEALEMIEHSLGSARDHPDVDGELLLARLCDHLPLALRIAVARLITSPGLTVATLAEELRDEHQRLEALETVDAQVSVAAALSLTYQALPAPAARLFTVLGLHPGPDIDVYAAAALAGTGTTAARRALTSLVGCHLAYQAKPGRFASHDLVRLYARRIAQAELPPREQQAALGRLFDFYLATTRLARLQLHPDAVFTGHPPLAAPPQATPPVAGPGEAYGWFNAEEKIIRTLVTGSELHEHAWRLAHNSCILYSEAGNSADQEACLVGGLRAARAAGSQRGTGQLLARLGPCLAARGCHDEALGCLREAVELMGATPDAGDVYSLMNNLGHVERAAGQWAQAHRHYEEALAAARVIGRPPVEAAALNVLAWNCLEQSAPERALPYSQQAVDMAATVTNNEVLLAAVLHTHAWVLEQLDRAEDAASYYRLSLDVAEPHGYRLGAAQCYHGLGTSLARLGRFGEAEQNLRAAVDLFAILGRNALADQAREQLGKLASQRVSA